MNLVGSLHTLVRQYDSGGLMLVAWLGVLALAVVVFLVLIAVGAHRRDARPRPSDAGRQAALWQQFFSGRQGHGRR